MEEHYPIRVVALIDILGFKAALERSETDEAEYSRILETLEALRSVFLSPRDQIDMATDVKFNADTQITQVSDSLLISRPIDEIGGLHEMLSDCTIAIHVLIKHGFLSRGAITLGRLYHKNTILFGRAFMDVFEAEKHQKRPIVTFPKELFELARVFHGQADADGGDWEVNFLTQACIADGDSYYLDYFTNFDWVNDDGPAGEYLQYGKLREVIMQGLQSEDRGAYLKTVWAAVQFNGRKSPDHFDPIPLPDLREELTAEERVMLKL